MKPILFSVLFALASACGGSDTAGDTANTKKVQVDQDKQAGSASAWASCSEEIAIECSEGSVDGCGVMSEEGASLTLSHICVPESETFAGPGCEQEVARVCEEGLVDACGLTPAASSLHVCVAAPAALDAEMTDAETPDELETETPDETETDIE